ncbi:Uncharacterised protein [Vibrio cholerae]|nr:Uncharacterised protein [Vibrio cholerae]CSI82333.1 Uncharacterised protein [Vibrio cholerae]
MPNRHRIRESPQPELNANHGQKDAQEMPAKLLSPQRLTNAQGFEIRQDNHNRNRVLH